MNKWIMAAAAFSALTFFVHFFIGGVDTHEPLLAGLVPDLVLPLKAVLSVIWHAISAVLLINTTALFIAARQPDNAQVIVWIVCAQYLAFAALFIFYGLINTGTLALMPQWTIFTSISVLAYVGLKSNVTRPSV